MRYGPSRLKAVFIFSCLAGSLTRVNAGASYFRFMIAPQLHLGFPSPSISAARMTTISHLHPGFVQPQRWPSLHRIEASRSTLQQKASANN